MDFTWLKTVVMGPSIAHTVFILALVIASGIALSRIKIKGVSFGMTWILFTGIVALAHSLDLDVMCEGVETEEQKKFVVDSGCDYIQGWYYAKVLSEDEAEEFATDYMNNI